MSSPEPERINVNELRPGPIRHESLPPQLLAQIGAIYDLFGKYLNTTLEQFETSFMRDSSPGDEVVVWCSIAAAWTNYHDKYLAGVSLPDDQEKKLIGALIAISAGEQDLSRLGLPEEIGSRLMACYDGLAGE